MDHFPEALKFALSWEGGFVNDPDDAGGATNRGVTQAVYDAYRKKSLKTLQSVKSIKDAEVSYIYRNLYFVPAGCDKMTRNLAIAMYDTAVNFGVGRAKQFLAKTSGTDDEKARQIVAQRIAFRHRRVKANPTQAKFLKGWLNRDNALGKLVG